MRRSWLSDERLGEGEAGRADLPHQCRRRRGGWRRASLGFVIHGDNNELKPYLHVRSRLEALVSQAVMYQLVELGRADRCRRGRDVLPAIGRRDAFPSCQPPNWMRCRDDKGPYQEVALSAADSDAGRCRWAGRSICRGANMGLILSRDRRGPKRSTQDAAVTECL